MYCDLTCPVEELSPPGNNPKHYKLRIQINPIRNKVFHPGVHHLLRTEENVRLRILNGGFSNIVGTPPRTIRIVEADSREIDFIDSKILKY